MTPSLSASGMTSLYCKGSPYFSPSVMTTRILRAFSRAPLLLLNSSLLSREKKGKVKWEQMEVLLMLWRELSAVTDADAAALSGTGLGSPEMSTEMWLPQIWKGSRRGEKNGGEKHLHFAFIYFCIGWFLLTEYYSF